jgi:lipoprotein-anchoring transpeptidase ErfK/SrfK
MRRVIPALLAVVLVGPAAAASGAKEQFPAAGELRAATVVVRSAPDSAAPAITVLRQFRADFRRQIVFAETKVVGKDRRAWYRIRLTHRPNGTLGWIPTATANLAPVANRIVVHRGARRLEVFRGEKLLFRTIVAVGAPGMETPLGNFYVTARFVPDDDFLGVFALETSAYSRLSEWPGGGVVGIHGTSKPWLLGQAVSHGCIRISNAAALRLKALAPLGTSIQIVA